MTCSMASTCPSARTRSVTSSSLSNGVVRWILLMTRRVSACVRRCRAAHASADLGDRVPRGIVVGRMTQGVHDLIEHALAGLDAQITIVVVGGGLRPQRGQPFLDEVLLPVQCVDLQLLEAVRIHAARCAA